MALPVVLIHGYSTEGKTVDDGDYSAQSLNDLYGRLIGNLADMGVSVVPVNVSRYISLDDGIGVDDISLAFQRALIENGSLLDSGFDVIVHSTGALVARNWIRRFWEPDGNCPLKRLIYLAGANLGSGWAHIGSTQFARFARSLQGTQPGKAVLEDLELGSDWAIDLHTHFLADGNDMFHNYGVMEFNIVGSQTPPEYVPLPIRYGKEDGSDGVVRVSASNLNINYLKLVPTATARSIDWDMAVAFAERESHQIDNQPTDSRGAEYYRVLQASKPNPPVDGKVADERPQIPFAIPYNTDHSDMHDQFSVVSGSENREFVVPLIKAALSATRDTYANVVQVFDDATNDTYERVKLPDHDTGILGRLEGAVQRWLNNPKSQYDGHAQVVVRVCDHLGNPVNDTSIFFNSFGGSEPDRLIDGLFEDHHQNNVTANTTNFYLRLSKWDGKDWALQLPRVNGATLEIDAVDPSSQRILYLPLRYHISPEDLLSWFQPHRTTIIDVTLMRLPHKLTFLLR